MNAKHVKNILFQGLYNPEISRTKGLSGGLMTLQELVVTSYCLISSCLLKLLVASDVGLWDFAKMYHFAPVYLLQLLVSIHFIPG